MKRKKRPRGSGWARDEVGAVDCDGHDDGSVGHPQLCHRYHGCHAVVEIVVGGVDGPGGGGYVAVWCGGWGGAILLAAGDEQQGQQEGEEGYFFHFLMSLMVCNVPSTTAVAK